MHRRRSAHVSIVRVGRPKLPSLSIVRVWCLLQGSIKSGLSVCVFMCNKLRSRLNSILFMNICVCARPARLAPRGRAALALTSPPPPKERGLASARAVVELAVRAPRSPPPVGARIAICLERSGRALVECTARLQPTNWFVHWSSEFELLSKACYASIREWCSNSLLEHAPPAPPCGRSYRGAVACCCCSLLLLQQPGCNSSCSSQERLRPP